MNTDTKTKNGVPFRLVGITTEEFSSFKSNFDPNDSQLGINMSMDIKVKPADKIVGMFTRFEFSQNENPIMILESACHFNIEDTHWGQMINGAKLIFSSELLTHFLVLSVGTARGILHANQPQWLPGIVLPTFDVSQFITEDGVFELEDDKLI